jgi:hypothetical protein
MARNFLKHRKEVLDKPVEIRLEVEAMNAITRAVANYAQLSEHVTEPMANYLRWMWKEHGNFMNGIIDGQYLKQLDIDHR